MKESRLARKFRRDGEVERLQTDLLMVLRTRFGDEATPELTSDVRALDDLELLERLFKQALTVVPLDEFRSALPAAGTLE
jgi:hypothetical protein